MSTCNGVSALIEILLSLRKRNGLLQSTSENAASLNEP